MLMCSQLKLSERRSISKLKNCNISSDSIVVRPCTQRNITEVQQKVSNIHPVAEKRIPELRVVSLNLEGQPNKNNDKKITRAPYRMPLFCTHFKSLQKNYQRDKKDLDENFIVRGFEVGSGNLPLTISNKIIINSNNYDPDEDDLNFLRNGIQIQLTDCCQCVCDLFNSNFPISRNDDNNDINFLTIDNSNSLRSFRSKDVVSAPRIETAVVQSNSVLDPNILKVIRVTMNTKNLTDYK